MRGGYEPKRDAEQWVQLFVDYYPNATGNAETAVLGVTTLGALVDFLVRYRHQPAIVATLCRGA